MICLQLKKGCVYINPVYIDVQVPFYVNIKTSEKIVSFTALEFESFEAIKL